MKIREVIKQLRTNELQFGTSVKIVSLFPFEAGRGCLKDENTLVGQTGTLTNPFSGFPVEGLGVFLDNPAEDCCNLGLEDEVEILI